MDSTQMEEHITSLRPSVREFECLRDPDLLWPEKGQPWPPSVERYVHRYMHESNLYQVYRSTEVKFGNLVRLLAAARDRPSPNNDNIYDSIARRCKQLISQSSKRWHSAGWLGLRGKTYYKKDLFQQCWNAHVSSISVREDPQKQVMSVPELLLSNADSDGQAKRGGDEPLRHADIPAKRNRTSVLNADDSSQALFRAGIDSLNFRSSLNRPTTLAPISEVAEEATFDRGNTNEAMPMGDLPVSQTPKQTILREASQLLPSTETEVRASPRKKDHQTDASRTEHQVDGQACQTGALILPSVAVSEPLEHESSMPRSNAPSPTLSSGPGTSERGFLTPPIEYNRYQSAAAGLAPINISLTRAPVRLPPNNARLTTGPVSLPRINTRLTTELACLPRINTNVTTPPTPASPLKPVDNRLSTAPTSLPQPVNSRPTAVPAGIPSMNINPATFEVAHYLSPAQIYLFRTVAKLLVQKLGEASAYSLLDTLMSFNLSAFFSWYSQIMRVDGVHALVFKLLGAHSSQSHDIVVIRNTWNAPENFQYLKHSICKVFKARASTRQYSDSFRVVVLPYPVLTPPQAPMQRASSSIEVLVRIQVTPEGIFSEPYHLNSIGAMRTIEDFFSWFSNETMYKQTSSLQALSFIFKDAVPSPITKLIERGNAQQFEYMKGEIQRTCYETLAYMPRMKDFTILVAAPGRSMPGLTVPG
ncbi:hypothetical protein O988_02065 [Pseudogymnoascus sp. VKM F-3808]|nr:hypothetical protein O988_02065 [Pseudogymnoascus sp. VKM F-3808]